MIEECVIATSIPTGSPPEYETAIVELVPTGFGTGVHTVVINQNDHPDIAKRCGWIGCCEEGARILIIFPILVLYSVS